MSSSLACSSHRFEIEVRGASSLDEVNQANQLFAEVQALGREAALSWLESAGALWPGHCLERVRLAFRSGRIVGALRVIDVPLRIGRARLRAGGIGWVSTHPDCRNQGVCAALMADTRRYLERDRFALSLLFGIPGLYQKYGYVSAIPERSARIDLAAVPADIECRHDARPFTDADIPGMLALFEAEESEASYSIVRTEAWTRAQALSRVPKTPYHADWQTAVCLLDGDGRYAGWLMPQVANGELVIKDLGVAGEEACASLLAQAVALARERGLERLRFLVPPFHPFARFLERLDSTHETRYFRDSDAMLAVIDAREALAAMVPEWEARVREGGTGQAMEPLHFCCAGNGFRVLLRSGGMMLESAPAGATLALDGAELAFLLGGCRRAEDILGERWVGLTESARRTVEVLFPRRAPFIWPIDHF